MKNIFILSKETNVIQALSEFLKIHAYGIQGTTQINQVPLAPGWRKFDLMIIDLTFSKEDIEKIKDILQFIGEKVPTLYLCDIPTNGDFLKGLPLKSQRFLIKPFKKIELTRTLRDLLSMRYQMD